jgi:hypothetical protein
MQAFGFMYRTYKILVELDSKDEVDGESAPLRIPLQTQA